MCDKALVWLMGGTTAKTSLIARLRAALLLLPLLAASGHAQVTMTVDGSQNHPISPFIYGVNIPQWTYGVVPKLGAIDGSWNVTALRLGGARWQMYNWGNNYSNCGSYGACNRDQNDQFLSSSTAQGDAVNQQGNADPNGNGGINDALAHSAGVLLDIPMMGYVSADSIPGNDVRCITTDFSGYPGCTHNPNYLAQRFTGSNPGYQQEFVNFIKTNWPASLQANAQFPIWFDLDNEPEIWSGIAHDIHPNNATYAEVVNLSTNYATAIKTVAPNALIFGAVTGVFEGRTSLNGASDGCAPGGEPGTCYTSDIWFLDYYLQHMQAASNSAGMRLLDVLDTHYYSDVTANGISIRTQDTSAAVVAARVQAPRSLWDTSYTENSYHTDSNHLNGPMKLIPRLQAKITNGYPGTKIAFSEWNFGGGAHISGGIAAADALGAFGALGVYAAMAYPEYHWLSGQAAGDPGYAFEIGAFKMYRNYDGSGGHFGDISVSAVSSDNAQMSIYASHDSTNPRRMVLVLINKTAGSPAFTINFQNTPAFYRGDVYVMTSAGPGPAYAGVWDNTNYLHGNQVNIAAGLFPAYSVVTVVLTANGPHDFSADGKSDIAWLDNTGNTAAWLMNGGAILQAGGYGNVGATWSIVGQRDFNGDGKTDWLWRDTGGNLAIWLLNGLSISQTGGLGNVANTWTVSGTADFNADGKGDILWRDSSGNTAIWLMNGLAILQTGGLGNPGGTWSIAGTADFDGDGKGDILWKDGSGNVAIWLMNGLGIKSAGGLGNVGGTWSVAGTGDFDGDGNWDILWRDSSGNVAIWLMNGLAIKSTGGLGNPGGTWLIAETGDYDGNGKSDILWRDGSGNTAIWFMNGLAIASTAGLGNPGGTWAVQGVNAD
jgi:glycosyl hydrolase family 44/VCBS repeat protein